MSIRKAIGNWLLRQSVRLDRPALTALLLRLASTRVGNPEARYQVLCVQRSIFVDDVRAMAEAHPDVCYVFLPKAKLNVIMRWFIDRDPEVDKLNEQTYHSGVCAGSLREYRHYLREVLEEWSEAIPFQAVLSGNFGYTEQQELARIVETQGIPFIVLFKEGLVIPQYLPQFVKGVLEGKRFLGSKILFYSDQIKDAVLSSSAFEGRAFESGVTGIPRLDASARAPLPSDKRIVFFSFYPEDKFRCFQSDPETLRKAHAAADAFHLAVFEFAQAHPDWEITVKTKVHEKYVSYVRDLYEGMDNPPGNVRITNRGEAAQMVLDAQAVIAFTSTTAVEATVARRRVIVPDFGRFFPDEPWDYYQDYPDLVTYARNAEDIARAVLGEESPEARDGFEENREQFLRNLVHGADGQASRRAVDEILQTIEARKGLADGLPS